MTIIMVAFLAALFVGFIVRKIFHQDYTWGEFLIAQAVIFIVLLSGYYIAKSLPASDEQILSGQVYNKAKVKVSCEHSYQCHCVNVCSGGGNSRTCSRICQTCYHHPYDFDWRVYTTVGDLNINRINSQGTNEPPRFTSVVIGEPASVKEKYDNWLKAAPDSLFKSNSKLPVPEYPDKIYDYYRIDRVVSDGVKIDPKLNKKISEALKTVAKQKQVNLVVVLTNKSPDRAKDFQAKWINGRKNDLVVIIGGYPEIKWVRVFGWSKADIVNVRVRDALLEHKIVNEEAIDVIIKEIAAHWQRKPMSDYEYLKDEIEPSLTAYIVIIIISIIIGGGVSFILINNQWRKQ